MPTRNVVLTDHQSALIDRLVAEGRYQNASEAVRAGLRLMEHEETRLEDLRARLDAARRDADGGVMAEGTAENAVRRAADRIRRQRREAG